LINPTIFYFVSEKNCARRSGFGDRAGAEGKKFHKLILMRFRMRADFGFREN